MGTLVRLLQQGTSRSREHAMAILPSLYCNNRKRAIEACEAEVLEHCKEILNERMMRSKGKASALRKDFEDCVALEDCVFIKTWLRGMIEGNLRF